MSDYSKFFDEKINRELAKNAGYLKCLVDYKKCKDFVQYFKQNYPRLRSYIAGSITPASILAQPWKQMLTESRDVEISQAEYQIRYFWYDKKKKSLWEEKLETTKLFYAEVEQFVDKDLETTRSYEKLEKKTAKNMAIIEKHVSRKVLCDNIDAPELKNLLDDLIAEKNKRDVGFKGYIREALTEEIEYAKLQTNGRTNTTLEVIKSIKETTVKKK